MRLLIEVSFLRCQIQTLVSKYRHFGLVGLAGHQWETNAVSQFRVCTLRRSNWNPIMSKQRAKAVPFQRLRQMRPPCFWRMPRYCPLWPHISQDSLCARKKKTEKEKMVRLRGADHHFCRPGRQKSWRKGKTSGEATRKYSKGWQLMQLKRSLQRTRLQRLKRPGPSKDADPEIRHSMRLSKSTILWPCVKCSIRPLGHNNALDRDQLPN